ncbi:hypothetical protein [Psychrobacter sp. LV10R520-6]|uniref:hypothetical protein n=1 Tax=Psychrobacter sp. LV10R520-6 TaxID=1415574 RepID=UPI0024C7CE20|nr:hypothetical protein [Psychrobacter sp. LV10R520-6]SNT69560.1 hypothetical protein SAMN04488491_0653 [Psychrobacter sp. LV10R520-6]
MTILNTTFTKTATLTATLAAALALSACQSTPSSPVIQRANSIYETTGIATTKVKAQQNALDSAKNTCRGKQVIVVEDKVKYNGILDENTGRMIDQVGAVVGSIFGTGSPNLSRDDDYEYMINFRCQ